MEPNLITAIVSASATALVAIVALILNSKRFEDMGKRFDDINKRFDDLGKRLDDMSARMDRIERRLELIESDLKEFFRSLNQHDKRIQRLEDKQ